MRSGMKREVKKSYSWKSKIEKDKLSSRQMFFGCPPKNWGEDGSKSELMDSHSCWCGWMWRCSVCTVYTCVCVGMLALSTAASCGWCRQRRAGGSWWCGVEAPESFCSFYHTGTWRASEHGSECGGRSWRGTWYHSHSAEKSGNKRIRISDYTGGEKTTRCCIYIHFIASLDWFTKRSVTEILNELFIFLFIYMASIESELSSPRTSRGSCLQCLFR